MALFGDYFRDYFCSFKTNPLDTFAGRGGSDGTRTRGLWRDRPAL